MSAIAVDISIPVQPIIIESLHADIKQGPLIITLYLAGFGLSQIPVGLIADRIGRLPVLYAGMIIFIISGLVCASTDNITVMLIARFFQGIGGAMGPVLGRAIIRDISSGVRVVKLMSLMLGILGIAMLVSPLLGSLLNLILDWRAVFFFTSAIGLLVVVLLKYFLWETRPVQIRHETGMNKRSTSFKSFITIPQCLWGTGLVGLVHSGYLTIVSCISTILADVYGLSATLIGVFFAMSVIPYIVAAVVNHRLVHHAGILKILNIIMVVFMGVGLYFLVITFIGRVEVLLLWSGIAFYIFVVGIIMPNATSIALFPLPQAAGFSASMIGTFQMVIAIIASSLSAYLYSDDITSLTMILAVAAIGTVFLYILGVFRIRHMQLD